MIKGLNRIAFLILILFQILPILIAFIYIYDSYSKTDNSGWIYEKKSGCKLYTERNYENREFIWSGDCQDGLVNGYGKLTLFQNNNQYYIFEGFISMGRAEGAGKLKILSDGDTYEGNYKNGKPHGFGRFHNDDGDYYEGQYENGMRSGKGTYWYDPESKIFKYVGQWKVGKKNGKGTLFYRNGKTVSGTFNDGIIESNDE